jgi:hypothetical protein
MDRFGISHARDDESREAKIAWFRSLTPTERYETWEAFMDLVLAANPKLIEAKDAQPVPGRVQVLELARG